MRKRFREDCIYNFLLALILIVATFLRYFKFTNSLGFWYDQGRDALVVWDMLHKGAFTLIGPMMGSTGIFRGAWYYWLITPFYAISRGSPIIPAAFLTLTSIVAIYILYLLGKEMGGRLTGLMAAFIASVSLYIIEASRWFSDPTPSLLVSVTLIWLLFRFIKGKRWGLPLSGFLAGMALQFSAATEIFYIPAIFFIVYIFRRKVKVVFREAFYTFGAFLIAFVPQLIFEMRHPGVMSRSLIDFIFHQGTFTYAFWGILKERIIFDYNLLASKFMTNSNLVFAPFFAVFLILLILSWKKFWKLDYFKIVFTFALIPLLGTLFFVSNKGGVYDYYFTGYYLIWILIFSFVVLNSSKSVFLKIFATIFALILLVQNLVEYRHVYLPGSGGFQSIIFSDEMKAVGWIYQNAGDRNFNVDEYVPPVIPYSYNYLFTWLGNTKYNKLPVDSQVPLLYTLYEVDPPHPERLKAWLDRQEKIGKVVKEASFGGITVQERERIETK